MDTGVCVTCGAEEIDVNDEGKCTACEETKDEGEAEEEADGEDVE